MASSFWLFCWAIVFVVPLQFSYSANITVQPVSTNTTLNSTVIFTCEADADELTFRINNLPANAADVISKEFTVTTTGHGTGTLKGELKAIAYDFNNNTNIRCRVSTDSPSETLFSSTSVLLIQGLLASVGNLEASVINGSSVLLSWTAPYTLDNVPIAGYYITDGFNNTTTNNTNSTLSATDPDPCVLNNISVAAINGAGIGQTNSISFYYQRVPLVMPTVSVIPAVNGAVNEARRVSLNISINVTTLCIGEYPNNVTVNILTTNDTLINSTSISPQVNDQLMIITGYISITLPDTINTFIINISLSNNGGQFNNVKSFVFGFLRPVTSIRSSKDNCTTINIYWDSPTLDDDRVSILYYNLSIYDNITGSLVDIVIVNGTSYQFKDTDLFRHRYTYVITGVSELGKGISNSTTVSYQIVPRSAESTRVVLDNYTNNNVTVSFNIPVELECTGEAPENATVTIWCNETSQVYSNTTEVEYAHSHTPRDITGSVSVPQYEQCSLSIVFSNAVGSSKPFIEIFDTTPAPSTNTPLPTFTPGTPPTSPIFTTPTIAGIFAAMVILILAAVVLVLILLYHRKNKNKSPGHCNLLDEQVAFDGSNVRTSVDSTKGLLAFKSLTDEQPTTPTSPAGATGATGATKEPIYSDLGQAPKVGVAKPIQSEATVQYADINIIVPRQRATQSYDDVVVVGAGTTVIGGGPAVPPPVPAKGGESKPPPVPKKTKGATTTQMETENNNDDAMNLPHHVENEHFSSPPPPPLPPLYNTLTEGRREGGEEGGGPNAGEIHGTGLVSYL